MLQLLLFWVSFIFINTDLALYLIYIFVTEITNHPVSLTTAVALEDVILMCSASVDDVKYSWHCVDGHIPSHSQGRHNDTFTIYRATPHNEGTYYCKAMKDGVHVRSNNALIQIDGKELGI